jgi:hypothetical protein
MGDSETETLDERMELRLSSAEKRAMKRVAERAGDAVVRLAVQHGLGVFNVSFPTGEVYLPDANGELQMVHSG